MRVCRSTPVRATPTDHTLRHRLLASPVRSGLLALLQGSGRSMDVRELSAALALHTNTVREHLDLLVDGGLVRVETAPPAGRGRPALRYRSTSAGGSADREGRADGYRALASALLDQLAATDDPIESSRAAGERWGEGLAAPLPPVAKDAEAVDRLLELLDQAGFEPETPVSREEPIRLRRCPFVALARERRDVVCGVHLGMMQGVLRGLGAPSDGVSLEPFVAPDLCLAHLGGPPDA